MTGRWTDNCREADRQVDIEAGRQTDSQTDRLSDKCTKRHTHTNRVADRQAISIHNNNNTQACIHAQILYGG